MSLSHYPAFYGTIKIGLWASNPEASLCIVNNWHANSNGSYSGVR